MTIEVRPVRDDELVQFIDALSTGFLERPDVRKVADEVRPIWDLQRTLAAFDGGAICGTFRSWGTHLTVPGCTQLPAAAIAAVTVLPTHRRRGILRSMVAAEHAAARERGEAVGLLYASEYPIYGRFGYGPGCRVATWTLDTSRTRFRVQKDDRIELATPSAAARDQIRSVFETTRARRVGEIWRRDATWEWDLGLRPATWGPEWKGFLAVHRDAEGGIDGYVRYRAEENWEQRQPHNVLHVDDLHAVSDEASDALWRFVGSLDWVTSVKAERRSLSERLPWLLTNARAAVPSDIGDGMWVRLLDVGRALEARTYERDGRLVLEVVDAEAPDGRLRLELAVDGGVASTRPSRRSPDLTVDVATLGAAYLGGASLRLAALAHGHDEHRGGALAAADGLFRTLDEPWCSTFF